MKLSDLNIGESATIKSMHDLDINTKQKLMEMGFLPDTRVTLVRRAPFGDPLQIKLRGTSLMIRKQTASLVDLNEDKNNA